MEAIIMTTLPNLTTDAGDSSFWLTGALSLSEMLANSSHSHSTGSTTSTAGSSATESSAVNVGKDHDKHVNDSVSTGLR